MSLRLTEATRADAAPVAALWGAASRAGFTDLLPPGHELPSRIPERYEALLEDPAVHHAVGEGDELRGFIAFGASRDTDAPAETGEVREPVRRPRLAAQRGRQRPDDAHAAELPSMGYDEATVWSFAANERANAFYERHDFRRDGAASSARSLGRPRWRCASAGAEIHQPWSCATARASPSPT